MKYKGNYYVTTVVVVTTVNKHRVVSTFHRLLRSKRNNDQGPRISWSKSKRILDNPLQHIRIKALKHVVL